MRILFALVLLLAGCGEYFTTYEPEPLAPIPPAYDNFIAKSQKGTSMSCRFNPEKRSVYDLIIALRLEPTDDPATVVATICGSDSVPVKLKDKSVIFVITPNGKLIGVLGDTK